MFWFILEHRHPESPNVSERQQRHIFPFKYHPRMSLASAFERLEKPQDRFPEEIFLFPLLPTTPNDRHQSFGWHGRNQRVPFILIHLLKWFLWLPISCFHGPSVCSGTQDCCLQGSCLCSGCRMLESSQDPHLYKHSSPLLPVLTSNFWDTKQQKSNRSFEAVSLIGQFVIK